MNYFFDCEFNEQGTTRPIELISIGIVAEDGREFYAENADVDLSKLPEWHQENVVPNLKGGAFRMPHANIGSGVLNFMAGDSKSVLWAFFGAYDWVLFCQLFGRMVDLPDALPGYFNDLRQAMIHVMGGYFRPRIPVPGKAHNALNDAHWNRLVWLELQKGKVTGPWD